MQRDKALYTYFYPAEAARRLLKKDGALAPFQEDILLRLNEFQKTFRAVFPGGNLIKDTGMYQKLGLHKEKNGWCVREWLPRADKVWLLGDFNNWQKTTPLHRLKSGFWIKYFPSDYVIRHGDHYKLLVEKDGIAEEHLPACVRYTEPDPRTHKLCGVVWDPPTPYEWQFPRPVPGAPRAPLIYEVHPGMATEREGIGSWREFADTQLQRVADLGYTVLQLMAVAEHPYYASFGYQVTNLFAPSHYFGTPDDLKYLVDKAHGLGLRVIFDLVHSHASANPGEGLYRQDGAEGGYFLTGPRGRHPAWGTLVYDYTNPEVLRYLLSNLRYWLEEFCADGFRFDGVTSMIYENHGLEARFSSLRDYYSLNTNISGLVYLTLANLLVHSFRPDAITVAEDMSGMPGMCLPIEEGGIGFDYRLAMGIPDRWIRMVKETSYGHWDIAGLWHLLTENYRGEKTISYTESHDQALVGDKTLFFRMTGPAIYTDMSRDIPSLVIEQAMDYHKLARLITFATANGGTLTFMGNEFGHPEWIDFPREGNGWSYAYARRQWSLEKNPFLRYQFLSAFEKALLALLQETSLPEAPGALLLSPVNWSANPAMNQMLVFTRGKLVFLFNFCPDYSEERFFVPVSAGRYQVCLSSDDPAFGGTGRISPTEIYTSRLSASGQSGFLFYLPARTAAVLKTV